MKQQPPNAKLLPEKICCTNPRWRDRGPNGHDNMSLPPPSFEGPTVALKAKVTEATYVDHLSEALDQSSDPFLNAYVLQLM